MPTGEADHLLVVDDDSRMLGVLRLHLEEAGYRVTTVDEGAAALEVLSGTEVDLVLSDVCMPGLDGVALMEEIEARKPDTPVVLMTAFGTVASAVASGPSIGAADLPPEIGGAGRAAAVLPSGNRVRDRLQQQILDALEETGGNRTAAARNLGIDRRTLQRHLARMSRERDS